MFPKLSFAQVNLPLEIFKFDFDAMEEMGMDQELLIQRKRILINLWALCWSWVMEDDEAILMP